MNINLWAKAITTYIQLKLKGKPDTQSIWELDFLLFCRSNNIEIVETNDKFFTIRVKQPIDALLNIRHKPSSDFSVFKAVILGKQYGAIKNLFSADSKLRVVDAGGNVGFTSVYLKKCFPQAEIVALEPFEQNVAMFKSNCTVNGFSGVTVLPNALWYEKTTLYFDLSFRDSKEHSVRTVETVSESTPITTNTIAELMELQKWDGIDVLKIDIEGSEKDIFEKDTQLDNVLSKTKLVAIEIHDEFKCREQIMQKLRQHYSTIYNEGELTIAHNF
jgi:FkbM family methyltransferase